MNNAAIETALKALFGKRWWTFAHKDKGIISDNISSVSIEGGIITVEFFSGGQCYDRTLDDIYETPKDALAGLLEQQEKAIENANKTIEGSI